MDFYYNIGYLDGRNHALSLTTKWVEYLVQMTRSRPPEQAPLILLTEKTQKLFSRMLDLKLIIRRHIHRADDLIDVGDLITQRLIARGFINRIHLPLHELRRVGRQHP